MRKISKIVVILVIILMGLFVHIKNSDKGIFAETDSVEFKNFEFKIAKIRDRGKMKVELTLSWDTKEVIIIEQITSRISDLEQISQNIEYHQSDNKDLQHYEINYTIQNWQTGTLELEIKYKNFEEISEVNTKKFYIPGGKWLKEEVSWGVSLIFGFLTTVCVGIGTFIIIENSKKGYDDSDSDE